MLSVNICSVCDIVILSDGLGEFSATEIVQEASLAAIVIIHLSQARRHAESRQCNILIAGFFTAMFFRELDALFDIIYHGSWVFFSLAVSVMAIFYAILAGRKTLEKLSHYICTPQYGIMLCGIICILVFSRLFGMHYLWETLLKDNYMRTVKNIVEKGMEMFGYSLCLLSSLGYIFQMPGLKKTK
ncbi:transporter [Escherichia coli]|uniref:transporter n=1 Tax=Escherichia coli TaxID=562 RepID=UPI000BB51FB0|nr:transporter [Escherichia coli]ATC15247.1 transporter [Escherichia coli]